MNEEKAVGIMFLMVGAASAIGVLAFILTVSEFWRHFPSKEKSAAIENAQQAANACFLRDGERCYRIVCDEISSGWGDVQREPAERACRDEITRLIAAQ